MSSILKNRAIRQPILHYKELPLYFPKELIDALPDVPDILFPSEIRSRMNTTNWKTGEENEITTLNLLRETNAAPELSQAQILHSIRDSCETDVQNLNAKTLHLHEKILDLILTLAEVNVKYMQKQRLAIACTSCLSPIRRLPLETLGEIFLHYVSLKGPPSPDEIILLTRVCSRWRRAALAFPYLWATLSLKPPLNHGAQGTSEFRTFINQSNICFTHSKNGPLTIYYHALANGSRYKNHTSIDMVIPHMNRIQKLYMSGPFSHIRRVSTLPPGRVERLKSVHLNFYADTVFDLKSLVFSKAPCLREFTLESNIVDPLSTFILPWDQLTLLNICEAPGISQNMLFNVFCACCDLVTGSFKVTTDTEYSFKDRGPHSLKSLRKLSIALHRTTKPLRVLNQISCPFLEEICIDGGSCVNLADISLNSVLQTARKLQTIGLTAFRVAIITDLLYILQSTPHLVNLRLRLAFADGKYDPLIDALNYAGDGTYVPRLQSLDIFLLPARANFHFSETKFITMLRSRQICGFAEPPVAHLEVHLRYRYLGGTVPLRFDILHNAQHTGEILDLYIHDGD